MTQILIGLIGSLLQITLFEFLKQFKLKAVYALALSGIAFLYVGFTWTDTTTVIIAAIQAILFFFIAYFGFTKSLFILAFGYFLHGIWDICYSLWFDTSLIPHNYDLFCLTFDYTIAIYLTTKAFIAYNRVINFK